MKKAIILTGISSGLGKALFALLKNTDAHLFCISRRFSDDQQELAKERKNITLLSCDLSSTEDTLTCTKKLQEGLAGFDDIAFVNNAATIRPIGSVGELDDESIIAAAHTNYVSPVLMTNALCRLPNIARLIIINISTGAAKTPIVGWPLYCSTKAAMQMFFSVLEKQYTERGKVAVHEFEPGVMDTPMQETIRQSDGEDFPRVGEFKKLQTDGKLRSPESVAAALIQEYLTI